MSADRSPRRLLQLYGTHLSNSSQPRATLPVQSVHRRTTKPTPTTTVSFLPTRTQTLREMHVRMRNPYTQRRHSRDIRASSGGEDVPDGDVSVGSERV